MRVKNPQNYAIGCLKNSAYDSLVLKVQYQQMPVWIRHVVGFGVDNGLVNMLLFKLLYFFLIFTPFQRFTGAISGKLSIVAIKVNLKEEAMTM